MADLNVIASSKDWNARLPQTLFHKTGQRFQLVRSEEDLTAEYLAELSLVTFSFRTGRT
jgi:hypothetical protein